VGPSDGAGESILGRELIDGSTVGLLLDIVVGTSEGCGVTVGPSDGAGESILGRALVDGSAVGLLLVKVVGTSEGCGVTVGPSDGAGELILGCALIDASTVGKLLGVPDGSRVSTSGNVGGEGMPDGSDVSMGIVGPSLVGTPVGAWLGSDVVAVGDKLIGASVGLEVFVFLLALLGSLRRFGMSGLPALGLLGRGVLAFLLTLLGEGSL